MLTKQLPRLLAFFFAVQAVSAQPVLDSVYLIDWDKDFSIIALATGGNALALVSIQTLSPRSMADLDGLTHGPLIGLDEKAIGKHSAFAQKASDFVAVGSGFLPLSLLLDKRIRQDALEITAMATEAFLINQALALATKRIVRRNRPYVFDPAVSLEEKRKVKSMLSFYSGHTAMTASMSFFSAKIWSDYHPDSRWKPVVWTAAATLPALTGYLRYKAGKHYFTDVAAGYAMGALVGYMVPNLHKKSRATKRRIHLLSNTWSDGTPMLALHFRL